MIELSQEPESCSIVETETQKTQMHSDSPARKKFDDLTSAGHELAQAMEADRRRKPIVLAIANAGVPVALPVAKALHSEIDLIAIRRLFAGRDGGLPVAAVSVAGHLVLDPEWKEASSQATSVKDHFIPAALKDLSARVNELRGNAVPKDVAKMDVILVDNGIHTGSTIQIAIRALRSLNPSTITVAVPAADARVKDAIEAFADSVHSLHWYENFGHAGLWYRNFNRPTDADVGEMMRNRDS